MTATSNDSEGLSYRVLIAQHRLVFLASESGKSQATAKNLISFCNSPPGVWDISITSESCFERSRVDSPSRYWDPSVNHLDQMQPCVAFRIQT